LGLGQSVVDYEMERSPDTKGWSAIDRIK